MDFYIPFSAMRFHELVCRLRARGCLILLALLDRCDSTLAAVVPTSAATVPSFEAAAAGEAARVGVDAATVIELNKDRLKGLSLSAVLLKGTRLLVRGSSVEYEEYCHWTYPGDDNSNNCASYMMARKLKPLQERAPPADDSIIERTRPLVLEERPEPHASGKRKSFVERSRSRAEEGEGAAPRTTPRELFNRVVTIEGEDGEDGKSPYFYVLTYLPDLQWCHVAPLQQVGTFEEGDIAGRPKFMLVPEEVNQAHIPPIFPICDAPCHPPFSSISADACFGWSRMRWRWTWAPHGAR